MFSPSLYPHSHKQIKTTQYFIQLKRQQKTLVQCRQRYLPTKCASFPGEPLSRKGGCCFLMNCSPQTLFSSNDGFPRVPVTAHSRGSPCLPGQNSIHWPSSSIHCYLILRPAPHPPPRPWPLPSHRSLFSTATLQPITHVATRAVFSNV